MTDPELREDFARDVVLLKYVGLNPIVVHGGGPDITSYMQRLGMPVEFVGGLRVATPATVEIAKMVLVGKVNKDIVMRINRHGQPAVGLSGDDGQLFRVSTMEGRAARTSASWARSSASTRASSTHRRGLHPGDRLVGPTAAAARTTSTPTRPRAPWRARPAPTRSCSSRTWRAWLRDPADPASVVSECGADEVEAALAATAGGMRPKLRPASTRSTAASRSRTSSTAASRTRCCSSCSRTPASARRSAGVVSALAPTYARYPVEFVGSGYVLTDSEGAEYLDFLAGIAVCSLGHSHPAVVAAVREQAARLMHVSNLFTNAPMVRLAERLVERSFGESVLRQLRARRPTRRR